MFDDPIVDEVRKIRQEHAAKFNYDLDAIFEDIKQHEEEGKARGKKYVSLRAPQSLPNVAGSTDQS